MGFGASVGLRRAALGARSASAVGREPGLLLPPHRGAAAPGQAPTGAGAQVGPGRGEAWSERSAVGVRRRRPPWPLPAPSRRPPALPGRWAGGGGGAARGSRARGAPGASGAGAPRRAPPPGAASAGARAAR